MRIACIALAVVIGINSWTLASITYVSQVRTVTGQAEGEGIVSASQTFSASDFWPWNSTADAKTDLYGQGLASQNSTLEADGITANGTVSAQMPNDYGTGIASAESKLDVSFDVDATSFFTLMGHVPTLSWPATSLPPGVYVARDVDLYSSGSSTWIYSIPETYTSPGNGYIGGDFTASGTLAPGNYELLIDVGGYQAYRSQWDGIGGDYNVALTLVPEPEPTSACLMMIAGAGLLLRKRRVVGGPQR